MLIFIFSISLFFRHRPSSNHHPFVLIAQWKLQTTIKDHPPLVLEGLDSGVYYEVFVVALNAHGKGGPSPRLVFRTKYQVKNFISVAFFRVFQFFLYGVGLDIVLEIVRNCNISPVKLKIDLNL